MLLTLRESLDQLRLLMDAMPLPEGDINALLAGLRFRLQPRIEEAGMARQWHVDLLPLWPGCTAITRPGSPASGRVSSARRGLFHASYCHYMHTLARAAVGLRKSHV